jgi:hypothetical protein
MTFDEWFKTYPLPAEIDGMDAIDREQWTWALRSAYKTGVMTEREACAKVCRSEADRALWNFQNDLPENNAFWNGAEQMASSCENLIKTRVSA